MSKCFFFKTLNTLIIFSIISFSQLSALPTPQKIVNKISNLFRGSNTTYSQLYIKVEKKRIKRTIVLDTWSDTKKDSFFIKILSPTKDKGITFLKSHKNFWQYIPSINKEIKIESSLLGGSWMGTDFSNEDMLQDVDLKKDYTSTFIPTKDTQHLKLRLTPKIGTPTPWKFQDITVNKTSYLPVLQEYYKRDNTVAKKLVFSNIKNIQGKYIPTVLTITSFENKKPISNTILYYSKIQFNQAISAKQFTKHALRNQ